MLTSSVPQTYQHFSGGIGCVCCNDNNIYMNMVFNQFFASFPKTFGEYRNSLIWSTSCTGWVAYAIFCIYTNIQFEYQGVNYEINVKY